MQYKNIIISILLSLLATSAYAQVTVGSAVKPEKFSTVQVELDGVLGGISLPKVTTAEQNSGTLTSALSASSASSGLVVFNSDKNTIEYWDGAAWNTLSGDIAVANGLNKTAANVVKLGGDLTDASTVVNQAGFGLSIQPAIPNQGEKFEVNAISATGTKEATALSIVNDVVAINPKEAYTVNGNTMLVKNQDVAINSSDFKVNIDQGSGNAASTKLHVTNTDVLLDAPLHYKENVEPGYLLTSDSEGNARWDALRPLGAVVEGAINDDNVSFRNVENVDVTLKRITVPAGQWLILAQFNVETRIPDTANPMIMYNWVGLRHQEVDEDGELVGGETGYTTLRIAGANPEKKARNNNSYSTPNFSYYVNVRTPTQFWVTATSSNNGATNSTVKHTDSDKTFMGPSFFFAVRLDVPVE